MKMALAAHSAICTFGLAITLACTPMVAVAETDDGADVIVAANIAKTTPLAPLKNLVVTPLPGTSTANSATATATASHAAPVDSGSGEFLALPTLNAPVLDQAGALSAADNQQLSDQLRAIHEAGRAQIGLILVKSTQGEPIFNYAGRVFTAWKLGDAKRDNGLLIVVAVQDRKMQILTGYGLEGIIPDVVASRIIREQITPQFAAGNYAAGLSAGINHIDEILQQDPETAKAAADQMKAQQQYNTQSQGGILSGNLILLLIVLVVIGQFTRMFLGRFISSTGLAAAGVGLGLFTGAGLAGSLLVGGAVFVLLLVGVMPFLNILGSMGGGRRGGFGGGFGGGGGSFGGGGASGSW
ncbi:MAG: TPM domain-containing protein [Candidatus Saccharibacteria bacterium]|nr:TPM domain-containing protein [Moraxellaceae bacterium]